MPWQITLVASCRRVVPSYNNEDSDTFHVWKITSEQSTCSHCCLQYYGDDKVLKKFRGNIIIVMKTYFPRGIVAASLYY